jgi:hypothetical protein
MVTLAWLIRAQLRSRRAALAVIALVAALGATATFAAAGASNRTAHAYSRYLDRASVSDVVINPSLVSSDIDRVVRELPGVDSVATSALFLASVYEGPAPTKAQLDTDPTGALVLGSVDGRFIRMDRPALVKGRMPTGRNEVLVNIEEAHDGHVTVGDIVPLSFWSRRADISDPPETVEQPIGVEHATVVGIATLSDEVLPDGVYPRTRVIVSPDIAARYDCLPALPAPNAAPRAVLDTMAPADCAVSYHYYSLAIRGGDRGVTAALDAFAKRADTLTAALPHSLRDVGATYALDAKSLTRDEQARVERSITPISAALFVLAGAAGAITIALIGLLIARELGRARDEQLAWWRLGLTTRERWGVVVVPLLVAAGAGLVAAVPLAWLLSPSAPIGTVRSIDPAPVREISRWLWIGAFIFSVAFAMLISLLALRSSRRLGARSTRPRTSAIRRLIRASSRPAVDDGIRAAYSTNRGSGLVIALTGSAVAVFLAAVVFGSSLTTLTSTPAAFGWPWDVGVMGNFGYGGMNTHAIKASLDRSGDVRTWTALAFSNSITLDGAAVPTVFSFDRASTVDIAVVDGRLPTARDELALGARTAAERGLHVGDTVTVAGYEVASRRATVKAIVVLPPLGPFQADRAAPGEGMLIPQAMIKQSAGTGTISFVGIEIEPAANRTAVLAALRRQSKAWVPPQSAVMLYTHPVRPAEILNARSIRSAPLVVGGLLVVAATVGLAATIIASVRSRRRELAVLRTLGFTGRQLRNSVRVQTLAMMVGGFVVGAPLGIAIGSIAWRAFAARLGVVPAASIPVGWIVATAAGAALIAILAAAGPARVAARTKPADPLRSQ